MNEKTRSDFWKCACGGRILTSAESCGICLCKMNSHGRPATNVEVLIAWLSAGDERRKEIEIASRPTKAGNYRRYYFDDNGNLDCGDWSGVPPHASQMEMPYFRGLWEPLSE